MAILSNINGKFAVDSTGAVQFNGAAGTSGYILKSNGTGSAPTWVDGSTVIGGPYLPLSGGTLTGATATASGISFTVGGTLLVGSGGYSYLNPKITVDTDTNAPISIVINNQQNASSAEAKFVVATYGNSWHIGMGSSTHTYGNDLTFTPDASTSNAPKLRIATNGNATFAGVLALPDGSASAPSIGNTGDTNTGMYWPGNHQVGFAVNGSRKFYMSETEAFFQNLSSGVSINAGGIDVTGDSTFAGNVMPAAENAYNIGSASLRWEDLYVDDGFIRDAYIDTNIYHNGDTDTYINFTTDTIKLATAGGFGFELDSNRDINSPDRLYMRQTRFGYSSAYKVVQFGNAASTSAISLGYNPSSNTNGGFSGNEILIPNNIRILAPNAADNQFYGVMMFDSNDKLLIGSSNYLIDSNYIMAMDPATKRVGIGTNSPTANLEIVGSNGTNIFRGNFAGSADIFMGFDNANPYLLLQDNSNITTHLFQSNVNNYIVGSNVGIGNTNPQTQLQVTSNTTTKLRVNTTGVADSMVEILGYDAGLHIGDNTNGNRWAIWNDGPGTSTSLKFGSYALGTWYADASQVMTMTSSGNVGIGTTSPSATFQVGGGSANVLQKIWGSGTAGIQIFTNSPSTGTKIIALEQYFSNEGYLGLYYNGTEKVRFRSNDSSYINGGNVGIGTTSPSGALHVYSGTSERFLITGDVHVQGSTDLNINGSNRRINFTSGNGTVRTTGAGSVIFGTNSTERMRILSSGYIGMNEIPSGFATLEIKNISSTTYGLYVDYTDTSVSYGAMKVILTGSSTSPSFVDWWYGASQVGSVVTTGSSTQYLTSSDYRLKENIVPMSNATDRVKQLKPSRFNFIGHENTVDGLIAHEVAEVVPEAVSGEKDGLRADGTPKYQGIDEGKLVPLLIGAIQELEARVKELENK